MSNPIVEPTEGPLRRFIGVRGGLKERLITAGVGTIAIKVLSAGLGLATSVVLARALGTTGYGIYSYAFALLSLIAVPAQGGLPALVVRETARADVKKEWGLLRGLSQWSNAVVGWVSAVVVVGVVGTVLMLGSRVSPVSRWCFIWGAMLVPLIALGNLRGATLRGLRAVVVGQLPEYVLRPGLLVAAVGMTLLIAPGWLRADVAMFLHVWAAAVAFGIGVWLLRREPRVALARTAVPVVQRDLWLRSTLPLAIIAGVQVVITQLDTVVLGLFTPPAQVGLYRVASLAAQGVSFALVAIGLVTTPYFAGFHASGDQDRLQRTATASAVAGTLLALPVAIPLLLFGGAVLHLVFGPAFVEAAPAMAVLAVAQVINASFGTIGPLLIMAGHERAVATAMTITALGNLALCFGLIPHYGVIGAAVASASTLVVWNVLLWHEVRRRVGVDTSLLSGVKVMKRWWTS